MRGPRSRGALPSRPVSRILSRAAIHLSGLPGPRRAPANGPARPCTRWGLPGRRVTATPVRSYRTISPLPAARRGRRCHFCGTFPRVSPGRRYRPPRPVVSGLSSRAEAPRGCSACVGNGTPRRSQAGAEPASCGGSGPRDRRRGRPLAGREVVQSRTIESGDSAARPRARPSRGPVAPSASPTRATSRSRRTCRRAAPGRIAAAQTGRRPGGRVDSASHALPRAVARCGPRAGRASTVPRTA